MKTKIKQAAKWAALFANVFGAALETFVDGPEEDANAEGLADGVYVNVKGWTVVKHANNDEPIALVKDAAMALAVEREVRRRFN